MSTLTVTDVPLDAATPAQRLRRVAAAVRVSLRWWGTHRTLTRDQKEDVGAACAADARLLTAGKRIIDVRHPAFRKLTSVRSRVGSYWRGLTLPYTEPGVRLIRQADVEAFAHTLEGFREELAEAEEGLAAVYGQMKADARGRLGRLYNPADYPEEVRGLFGVSWDFPSVEPPNYLMRLSPELYAREQRRVAQRFEEAVQLAEQAFVSEFAKLVTHLRERLGGGDGRRRVFRDSAVANLGEFFEKFKRLSVSSSPELDELVAQAQGLVRGVTPQALRDDGGLRRNVAAEMGRVAQALEGLITEAPRRRLVRPTAPTNGAAHAAGG